VLIYFFSLSNTFCICFMHARRNSFSAVPPIKIDGTQGGCWIPNYSTFTWSLATPRFGRRQCWFGRNYIGSCIVYVRYWRFDLNWSNYNFRISWTKALPLNFDTILMQNLFALLYYLEVHAFRFFLVNRSLAFKTKITKKKRYFYPGILKLKVCLAWKMEYHTTLKRK